MIGTGCFRGRVRPRLLAVLIVCLAPALVRAETVVFRNECRSCVVVQSASVVRGVVVRDKPHQLRPGETTARINLDRDKIIWVYDGAPPNRLLFQGPLGASRTAHYYSIVPAPQAGRVQMLRRPPPPAGTGAGMGAGMGGGSKVP